jgi:hypothetical protein
MIGAHLWLDRQGYRIQFITDAALETPLPSAEILVLPESHLLSDRAWQHVIGWAENFASGQLHMGPHTGLLDERGQWRSPKQRSLFNELGVRPGKWFDLAVTSQHGGQPVSGYRLFETESEIAEFLESSDGLIPSVLKARSNIHVHTHRWCEHLGTGRGTQAIPSSDD